MSIQLPVNFMYESLGKRLRLLRHVKDHKLYAVAKSVGISVPQLSEIENGKYQGLSLHTLHELAGYYGVEVHQLLSPETPDPVRAALFFDEQTAS